MKTRSTILLLVLAAVMAGAVYFIVSNQPDTREREEAGMYVTAFHPDSVECIVIEQRAQTIRIEKSGNEWRITEPLKDRADKGRVLQILGLFSTLPRIETILPESPNEEEEMKREFGLGQPKMKVRMEGTEDLPEFLIGREAAVPETLYLSMTGDPAVHVVGQQARDIVNQPVDSYRDQRLTAIDPLDVASLVIERGEGMIELVREQEGWWLARPVNTRADSGLVESIINGIVASEVLDFVGQSELSAAASGLEGGNGAGKILFTTFDEDTPRVIHLGERVTVERKTTGEDGESKTESLPGVRIRYPSRSATLVVPEEIAKVVDLSPNDLRDRSLLNLNYDVVDRFRIQRRGRDDLFLVRDRESWRIMSPEESEANPAMAMSFLKLLNTTRVKDFVSDTATNLAEYGLDNPWMRVVVSSYVSENIPHGGAGKHVLADLAIGGETDDGYYARLQDQPFIVVVPHGMVAAIPPGPERWRETAVARAAQGAGFSASVDNGERTVAFNQDENGWTLNGRAVKESARLESFRNTLAPLRSIRWHEGEPAQSNALTVEFTADTGQTRTLNVHQQLPSGMWTASIDGLTGYFEISAADHEALRLPLTFQNTDGG